MTPAGRPDAVRRFVRRPLWWAVVALAAVAWLHLDDVASTRARDRALDGGRRATAEVDDGYEGGAVVPITFEHPEWGEIRTAFRLNDVGRAPEPASRIPIEISAEDPTDVALAGDRHRATDYLGFDLGLVAIPLVFFAGRWIGLRRMRSLMAAPGPSFSMLGLVRSTGRLRPRAVLELLPLDSPPGHPPLCSVPLLHTGALPLERTYTVEVKGSPRPLGRVVVRAGPETVLWPRGRAAPTRPPERFAGPPARPPERPDVAAEPLGSLEWPSIWNSVPRMLAAASAVTVAFGLMVTLATVANGSAAGRADRSSVVVAGTVVAADPGVAEVTIEYQPIGPGPAGPADGDQLATTIGVDDPDLFDAGSTVALRVDPHDDRNVRLASQPYDLVEPLVWGWLPAGATVAVLASWVAVHRRNRRIARTGWRPVDAWRVVTAEPGADVQPHAVAVAFPGAPTASCLVRVSERNATRWPARPAPAGRHPSGRHPPLFAAGSMAPGDPVALRIGGWAEPGVWVAEAAATPAAVERPGPASSSPVSGEG